ncbi:MAG TPA: hypothetical protein VJ464_19780 [Blastocatellia bacterium]|nr:hypothetical protein [Blastocatellia bacterium]
MTCEAFERVVTDLACEFLIEAAARKRALAHARACSRCAARLRHERALTAALNAAASTEHGQASAGMKTALLGAFQQQTAPVPVAAPPVFINSASRRPTRWLLAAAAALLLLAMLVTLQVLHRQSLVESSASSQPLIADAVPATDVTNKTNVQVAATSDKPKTATSASRRRMRPVFHHEMANRGDRSPETVTEFIPLTALDEATAMGSGTIMRVEMPRASLIAMGLPLNAERAHETVKADIVVGDDGLARAIRLVY